MKSTKLHFSKKLFVGVFFLILTLITLALLYSYSLFHIKSDVFVVQNYTIPALSQVDQSHSKPKIKKNHTQFSMIVTLDFLSFSNNADIHYAKLLSESGFHVLATGRLPRIELAKQVADGEVIAVEINQQKESLQIQIDKCNGELVEENGEMVLYKQISSQITSL